MRLTFDAFWPLEWFIPPSPRETGDVVTSHVPVPLKVEPLLSADIAHTVGEVDRRPIPDQGQVGVSRGQGRVETLHPHTGVQAAVGAPGDVPVAGHVFLCVGFILLFTEKLSCFATFISQLSSIRFELIAVHFLVFNNR